MDTIPPFVQNRAPAIDTAWASAVQKFNRPPANARTIDQTNKFKRFINDYIHQSTDKDLKKFDVRRKFQWEDVKGEVDAVVEEYSKQRSWSHPIRKVGRSFCNNASNLEVLLTFIPDGEYTSIICGALTLIYNAAKRMKAVRERILSCLGSLSELVKKTKSYLQIYYEDQDLWDVAQELYIGILEGVEGMTEWLDSNAYKKAFQALFKQNGYGKSIDGMIKKGIEDKVVAFRERFEFCLHLQIQKQGIQQGRQLETLIKMLGGIVKDREWEKKVNDSLQSGFRQMEQLSRVPNPQPLMVLALAPPVSQPFIDAHQLLYLLQVNPSTPPQDIEHALCEGQTMPSSWQARTAALMENPLFQAWLKSDQSTGLMVNGMDSQADEAISSPMTYFTGLLSHTLKQMNIAMPLTHLCGLHASPDDPLEGVKGMLRALTCQLIIAYGQGLDLSFINYTFLELVMAQDIRALCELFRGLLVSVSQGTVFCILDGISWFETQAKIQDLRVTMAFLQNLIDEVKMEGGSLTFKILVTSGGESQFASEWFAPCSILSLEEDIEDDGYGCDDMQMADLSRATIGQY